MEQDALQAEAIRRCTDMGARVRCVPVTGQAGTGKTTILRQVHDILTSAGYRVALCAPTGKAAKRIQQATGIEARTIHRLLEFGRPGERDPETGKALFGTGPGRDRQHPLSYDVVLADEYAMVNHEVHGYLMDALRSGARVCMFGDQNQLQPIEAHQLDTRFKTPFTRCLEDFKGVVLKTIYRQGESSGIVENAHLILRGRYPIRRDDFTVEFSTDPITTITKFVDANRELFMGTDGQIIIPTNKGKTGCYAVNRVLQDRLNYMSAQDRMRLPRHSWDDKLPVAVGVGDKVIWNENQYDMRDDMVRFDPTTGAFIPPSPSDHIMNGETGVVLEIEQSGSLWLDVGDRNVFVPHSYTQATKSGTKTIDPRRNIALAWAITTHKAQGSEYGTVVYVVHKSFFYMLNRRNLYTGVTRARNRVHLIADSAGLKMALSKMGE